MLWESCVLWEHCGALTVQLGLPATDLLIILSLFGSQKPLLLAHLSASPVVAHQSNGLPSAP